MRGIRRILLAVLVVLVVGGAALWYFVLRDTSAPKLTLKDKTPSSSSNVTQSPASLAGTWKVVPGSGSEPTVAGYRVQEKFAAGVAKSTATGRTSGVTGTVTVAGTKVTAAKFTVDMTTLSSDKSQRDNQIKNRGVETNKFPTATFALTAPLQLPTIVDGKVFRLPATGNLSLHGVTKKVSVPLEVREDGSSFAVKGSLPIVMADYSIDPPSIGGFVSVDGNGSFEFLANLTKS